jgi:methionine sulfoxide reductase heme-binding subunit
VSGARVAPRPAATRGAAPRLSGLRALKVAVFLFALYPLARIVWDAFTGGLAAEPVKDVTHRTGWWALVLLTATLAVTPLRRLTGWNPIIQLRRPLGLFAFFYATLHLLIYFGLDHLFSPQFILEDILKRPFITVGFLAWLVMVPLAVTSTRGWIRRLGRRWQQLHRLVYLAAGLGVVHFYWHVKADTREPLVFAGVVAVLLGARLVMGRRRSPATPAR